MVTHVTTAATATATVQPISVAVVNADFGSVDKLCNSRLIWYEVTLRACGVKLRPMRLCAFACRSGRR